MSKEVQKEEDLVKSMDQLIDEFFAEEADASESSVAEETKEGTSATLNKASDAIHEIIGEPKQAKEEKDPNKNSPTRADDPANDAPKSEEDEKAGKKRGRPEDLSQMANRDMSTGESKGAYDSSVSHASVNPNMSEASQVKQPENLKSKGSDKSADDSDKAEQSQDQKSSDHPELKEFSQVRLPEHLIKGDTVEISKEEYETLKKFQAESLKKADVEQTSTLIKAEVEKATSSFKKENEDLRKEVEKTTTLLKALVKKPQPRKSISSLAALEKGGQSYEQAEKFYSRDEKLDAAEELVKSKDLTLEDVIELENTGTLLDPAKRARIERKLQTGK